MMTEKKYHDLWYLQLKDQTVLPLLYFLKTASIQQISEQIGKIARHEWSGNHFTIEWESFIANEHTHQFIEDPTKRLLEIHEILQPISKLLFPHWIMDRYKEALDQHVRGEWMSSISLCGDIVESIAYEFWTAYNDDIPGERRKTPSDSTQKNLKTLSECDITGENRKILDKNDYDRLFAVRHIRDTHVHFTRRESLLAQYAQRLKSHSIEVLRKLAEFFTIENMESKYGKYLEYAKLQQAKATEACK